MQHVCFVALLVHDYDEAIDYFTSKLDFSVVYDEDMGSGKRWILVAPPGSQETRILLAKAITSAQSERVGAQCAEKVSFYLHTSSFWKDYETLRKRGVEFVETPREEAYGTVVVFRDLYGNKWDLLQLRPNEQRRVTGANFVPGTN